MVSLSLQFGNAPALTVGYAIHGMVLCAFCKKVETGYAFGKLALNLLIVLVQCAGIEVYTFLLFGGWIQHHQEVAVRARYYVMVTAGMEMGESPRRWLQHKYLL